MKELVNNINAKPVDTGIHMAKISTPIARFLFNFLFIKDSQEVPPQVLMWYICNNNNKIWNHRLVSFLRFLFLIGLEHEGIFYKVVIEEKTWEESENNCIELGGHLATVTSPGLNKVLGDKLDAM